MSGRAPITIARFTMEHEARVAAEELEAAGIAAYLADTESGTMFGTYVGTAFGGVRLQVVEDDVLRAREILGEEVEVDVAEWTCPACGTSVDAGFELCWNCGAEHGDSSANQIGEQIPDAVLEGERSGDREDELPDDVTTEDEITVNDAIASKALRSAVFMFVFPPILLMTSWLIVRLATLPLSPRGNRRFYFALFFTAFFVVVHWTIFRVMSNGF